MKPNKNNFKRDSELATKRVFIIAGLIVLQLIYLILSRLFPKGTKPKVRAYCYY